MFEKSRVRSKSLVWPAPQFKAPNSNRFLNLHKAQVAGDDLFPNGDLTSSENESEVTDEIPEGFTEAQMDELELKKKLKSPTLKPPKSTFSLQNSNFYSTNILILY